LTVAIDEDVAALEQRLRNRLHPLTGFDEESHRPITDPRRPDRDEADYKPAAVLAGLIPRPEGVSVLLTRRSDALRRHSGQVALPGGRAEPGETPVQTALREAEEEVGLSPRFVRPIGLGDLYRTGTGYAITPVIALIRPGFALTPDPGEVAEIFETPFRFLMDPANHERRSWIDDEGEPRPYYAMPHEGRMIWGVTAGLFRSLYERLFED
jgi:8-oxo-dGTP pyrophosphatase MutT (NUDIX family)